MLLVLPVPFRVQKDRLLFERQACNGLQQWGKHFDTLTIAAPVVPESLPHIIETMTWQKATHVEGGDRIHFVPLPWAYKYADFVRSYRDTRKLLATLISDCQYLQFAPTGLIGDWALVAALEATQQSRSYCVHLERVSHVVNKEENKNARLKHKIKANVTAPFMKRYHHRVIRDADLALLHGADCQSAYAHMCRNSHVIHNIHTKPTDCIDTTALNKKIENVQTAKELVICYAGRASPIKAPFDWIRAIGQARNMGARVRATWLGTGPLLEEMKKRVHEMGWDDCIHLPGFIADRTQLLATLRQAHAMLFTHVTPESPRCLIEALVCGTPIVGYDLAYPRDLVNGLGGGLLVPVKGWAKLGNVLAHLYHTRSEIIHLIRQASKNGARFNDEAVFRERSELIKTYLN